MVVRIRCTAPTFEFEVGEKEGVLVPKSLDFVVSRWITHWFGSGGSAGES